MQTYKRHKTPLLQIFPKYFCKSYKITYFYICITLVTFVTRYKCEFTNFTPDRLSPLLPYKYTSWRTIVH